MKKNNQKGQALIELIIFLPLMFMFYSMISGFANAINGSINQQKITRAYFYYRVQNNPTIPKPDGAWEKWSTFGMFYIGWKDMFTSGDDEAGGQPLAACYKLSIPLAAAGNDSCAEKYTTPSTQYIRVQTVYGVCGTTYFRQDSTVRPLPTPDYNGGDFNILIKPEGCLLLQ